MEKLIFQDIQEASNIFAKIFNEMKWKWLITDNLKMAIPDKNEIKACFIYLLKIMQNKPQSTWVSSGKLRIQRIKDKFIYRLDPKSQIEWMERECKP